VQRQECRRLMRLFFPETNLLICGGEIPFYMILMVQNYASGNGAFGAKNQVFAAITFSNVHSCFGLWFWVRSGIISQFFVPVSIFVLVFSGSAVCFRWLVAWLFCVLYRMILF
jgi:hypothetical protein